MRRAAAIGRPLLFAAKFRPGARAQRDAALLFFLFATLCGWLGRSCAGLRFGFFHRLAGFFGALGANFGALLAFLVEYLLAAEQFDEGLLGAVALLPSGADDAEIAAVAIAETRGDGVEQLGDGFVG